MHNAQPYRDNFVTLHRLSTVLQMSVKLFVIELVHFTISCSNSTWATRPFLIWLNYSCLGCSVSRRKTRLSIIWPCHSFISYAILQLILTPSLYLLIYLTSLYFWWWRPPISFTKSAHRDLTRVNPSLILTCARLHFQYGAGNCKKVFVNSSSLSFVIKCRMTKGPLSCACVINANPARS